MLVASPFGCLSKAPGSDRRWEFKNRCFALLLRLIWIQSDLFFMTKLAHLKSSTKSDLGLAVIIFFWSSSRFFAQSSMLYMYECLQSKIMLSNPFFWPPIRKNLLWVKLAPFLLGFEFWLEPFTVTKRSERPIITENLKGAWSHQKIWGFWQVFDEKGFQKTHQIWWEA